MGEKKIAPGPVVRLAILEEVLNQFRANSLWPMTFGLACCAIEDPTRALDHYLAWAQGGLY